MFLSTRTKVLLVVAMVVLIVLFAFSAALAFFPKPSGDPSQDGLTQTLGTVLVLPGSVDDLQQPNPPTCAFAPDLVIQAGQSCLFQIPAQTIGHRLELSLTAGTEADVELTPNDANVPSVQGTTAITPDNPHRIVYQKSASLVVACQAGLLCRITAS
jgi:hypothetical protein